MIKRGFVLAASAGLVAAKVQLDGMKHAIQDIAANVFDGVVKGSIAQGVALVWFYHPDNAHDAEFLQEYNVLAEDLRGMLKVVAVDCDRFPAKCKDYSADSASKEGPHLQVFPPLPQPSYKYNGKFEYQKMKNHVNKLLPSDKVQIITEVPKFKQFLAQDASKTKVMVFSKTDITDQKKLPMLLKGLSVDSVFLNSMRFAYIPGSAKDIIKLLPQGEKKTKELPAWLLLRGTGPTKKESKQWWSGDDEKKPSDYRTLHEWMNVHSESGMGDTVRVGKAATEKESSSEPIEVERLRELHSKSQQELCFRQKSMCAVYVSDGPIDEAAIDQMLKFEDTFYSNNDRGVKFAWMWTNIAIQEELKKALVEGEEKFAKKKDRAVEALKFPTVLFVKPPKKKREEKLLAFARLENGDAVTESTVGKLIESIEGGDAHYARTDLPKFAAPPKKEAPKKEEL